MRRAQQDAMRQIILSSSGAVLARVPRPRVEAGSVLVRIQYSLISTGTELAPLRATSNGSAAAAEPRGLGDLARRAPDLLGKAIQNPGLAWQRAKDLSRRKAAALKHRLLPPPAASVAAPSSDAPPADALVLAEGQAGHIAWRREAASRLEGQNGRLELIASGAAGVYQAVSQAVAVRAGHALKVALRGTAKGAPCVLGVLSGDRQSWLCQLALEDDFDEEMLVAAAGQSHVWLVWSLAAPVAETAGPASIVLERLAVSLEAVAADDGKLSDMNDLGWGVGYSASGEVVAVGEGVRDIRIGDRVACGGAGQANHAQYAVVKRNLVARVPSGCPIDLAATCTVGAIALQGVRRAEPRLGETMCVVGLGLLGLMTCQMLMANGCRVIGLDPSEERVARALELGIGAGAATPERFLDLALHATQGHGADATIITAAAKSDALINHAMKTTRRKGRVVIVGDIGLAMERADLYRKEIDVLISSSYGPGRYDPSYEVDGIDYPYAYVRWTQNRNMQAFLDLIASGAIGIRALVDEVVPLSDAPSAYKRLAESTAGAPVGVLIEYPDETATTKPIKANGGQAPEIVTLRGHRGPKPGRIGYVLVGAGAFGTSMLVPQMDKRKDRFDLRGVVSRDAVRGGNFARQRQLPILASDLGEVLKRDDIDLVVIATRHDQHAVQAAEALRAGKHVFVEKPLALSWDELDRVRAAYAARPVPCLLMVGFNRRFAPAAEALRQAVAGRAGPMVISYRLNGGFIPRDSWIQGKEGGGRNLGEACHMYDFFRALTGAPVATISAASIDPRGSAYLVNDNFAATLTYADGSLATLTYTANGPKTGLPKERVEAYCDEKAYVLDNFTSLTEHPSGAVVWSSGTGDKGHFEELSRLGDSIVAGAADAPIPFEEIIETTAVSLHIEDLLQGRV
jgi:predicted dehydrogenase/threonine dehydrogenase-like Zn-dependent dehydrogenase